MHKLGISSAILSPLALVTCLAPLLPSLNFFLQSVTTQISHLSAELYQHFIGPILIGESIMKRKCLDNSDPSCLVKNDKPCQNLFFPRTVSVHLRKCGPINELNL